MAEAITVEIVLDPATGELGVRGPINNKLLVLGMLESAKYVVLGSKPEPESKIVAPTPADRRVIG